MTTDWSPLTDELALWRRDGLTLPLWWRDDDATAPTDALDTLLSLSEKLGLPAHIAVIPKRAAAPLAARLCDDLAAVAIVHGWAHENHAPTGAKKAEFNHPRAQLTHDTAQALDRMQSLFGVRLLRVFVPPWNRIDPQAVAALAAQGYTGLSTFTPRKSRCIAGVVQINTHIDPIHWKAGGGLHDPETIIAAIVTLLKDRRAGHTDAVEPLGFLTHHLVHDPAIWAFTERCLAVLLDAGALPCNLTTYKELP